MVLTLKTGEGGFNVTNASMPLKPLEVLVKNAREQARKQCKTNKYFELELCKTVDLGPRPGGGEKRIRKIVLWRAKPIDEKLPSKGYQECFPDGHYDIGDAR